MIGHYPPSQLHNMLMNGELEAFYCFLTKQMSAKAGLKCFGEGGAQVIMTEMEQLLYRKVIHGKYAHTLTCGKKRLALKYLMFLKEKCSGALKVHGYADGRPQKLYKTKHKTSSPTVSLKALFLTCLVDAMEGCCVMTADIPGAFMQAEIDEPLFIKLEGDIALLLIRKDPSYQKCMTYKKK